MRFLKSRFARIKFVMWPISWKFLHEFVAGWPITEQYSDPAFWLVDQQEVHGRNFKLIGYKTSLISCQDSRRVIKKNLTNLSAFDSPLLKQCALNACALVRSQLPKGSALFGHYKLWVQIMSGYRSLLRTFFSHILLTLKGKAKKRSTVKMHIAYGSL